MDAVSRVGDSRSSVLEALECLADYCPCDAPESAMDESYPRNMIGPAIEAVSNWILDTPPVLKDTSVREVPAPSNDSTVFSSERIAALFAGIGRAFVGNVDEEDDNNSDLLRTPTKQDVHAPIDVCSGVVLHIFCSQVQDLPPNSHGSTNNEDGCVNSRWMKALSQKCAQKGLSINMWGLASFESDILGLSSWLPLAKETGGRVYRSVLGQFPKDERILLAEKLKRATIPQIATKCMFKLRCSPHLVIGENSATGNMISDESLPGVFRMGSCSHDSAFCFSIGHRTAGGSLSKEKMPNIVIQLAFQYNTLVEASDTDMIQLEKEDEEIRQFLKQENFKMGKMGSDSVDNSNRAVGDSKGLKFMENSREVLGLSEEWKRFKKYEESQRGKESMRSKDLSDSAHLGESDWINSSGYSHERQKRLVVVRRLRIITVTLECSPKLSRLLKSIDPPTVATLLVRQAMDEIISVLHAEDFKHFKGNGPSTQYRRILKETSEMIVSWAAAQISSNVLVSMTSSREQYSDASISAIKTQMHAPKQFELLRLLCGIVNMGRAHRSIGWNPDCLAEIASLVSSCDAYKAQHILTPSLCPVRADGEVDTSLLLLKRDSMIMSSGESAFLLDTGIELVLYRIISSAEESSHRSEVKRGEDLGGKSVPRGLLSFVSGMTVATPTVSEKASGNASAKNSPEIIPAIMESKYWLPNYVHNKLFVTGSTVLRPIISEAGTHSSTHFTKHLIEDGDGCGEDNESTIQSFSTFSDRVAGIAMENLKLISRK